MRSRIAAVSRVRRKERYRKLQEFFAAVHRLTSERHLSLFAYVAQERVAAA